MSAEVQAGAEGDGWLTRAAVLQADADDAEGVADVGQLFLYYQWLRRGNERKYGGAAERLRSRLLAMVTCGGAVEAPT